MEKFMDNIKFREEAEGCIYRLLKTLHSKLIQYNSLNP